MATNNKINRGGKRAKPRPAGGPTSERLQIVLPSGWPESGTALTWYMYSRDGKVTQGQAAGAAELPAPARAPGVHVWTPANETLLTHTRLPTRSRAQIVKALPFALEDQLLEDPEKQHFAYCRESDGRLAVAITARTRMQAWVAALRAAGIKPASFAPAILALPHVPPSWSVGFEGHNILVRTGRESGFACPALLPAPPDMLTAAIREAEHEQRAPQALLVFGPPPGFSRSAWKATLDITIEKHEEGWREAAGGVLPQLNLLQGEFAATGQRRGDLGPYRFAAVMLALFTLGAVTVDVIEWWQLRQAYQNHQGQMLTLLRETFPEIKSVLDPAKQMQRQLEQLQATRGASGAADLLPLLDRTAPAIAMNPQVRLRALNYNDKGLILDLQLPNPPALEALRSALQGAYLQTEVLTSDNSAGMVQSRLRVQALAAETAKGESRK
jgi:general secretion pathway protein L